jgi:hypothetical protein
MYHAPRKPVETPATAEECTSTEMEYKMYGQVKKLTTVLRKAGNFLQVQHPELICTIEKMNLFDEMADDPDRELGSSHGRFFKTSDATVRTGNINTPLYKSAYVNLNDDLKAESKRKPAAWREGQREGESVCTDTCMAASHAREETMTSDEEILKNKGDRSNLQKDATFSKFESGNQSDEEDEDISISRAEKRAILHHSDEDTMIGSSQQIGIQGY